MTEQKHYTGGFRHIGKCPECGKEDIENSDNCCGCFKNAGKEKK